MSSKKQQIFESVLQVVVECCSIEIGDGEMTITAEDILGNSHRQSVHMTRCLFVTQMVFLGYTRDTISRILKRSEKSISDMLNNAHQYRIQSFAYRQAEAESTIKLRDIMSSM